MFMRFDRVLGLDLFDTIQDEIPQEIRELTKQREEARRRKDFETADRLRDEIQSQGFNIQDSAEGPRIKQKKS